MDIKSMRCFLAVAETLNFSRAAESIYLSQPALSLRINAMEDELGVKLFLRTRQQVYLTAAGSALLPEVQEILARIDALPEIVLTGEDAADVTTGKLSLMLDSSLPEEMLNQVMEVFNTFCERYPDVAITVDSMDTSEYESVLLSRNADLCCVGLGEDDAVNPAFNMIPLKVEPMILAFSEEENLPNRQLLASRELLLLAGEERWNKILLNYLAEQQIKPKIRTIRGGPALCVNLLRSKTMTFMPKSFFDTLSGPKLAYRELDIPGARVLSTLVWGKYNYNPCLQLMINCYHHGESVSAH